MPRNERATPLFQAIVIEHCSTHQDVYKKQEKPPTDDAQTPTDRLLHGDIRLAVNAVEPRGPQNAIFL